jgi:hypothetical protein
MMEIKIGADGDVVETLAAAIGCRKIAKQRALSAGGAPHFLEKAPGGRFSITRAGRDLEA